MSKRTSTLIKRYKNKIKKLEESEHRRRRRVIIYSDSDSELDIENNEEIDTNTEPTETRPLEQRPSTERQSPRSLAVDAPFATDTNTELPPTAEPPRTADQLDNRLSQTNEPLDDVLPQNDLPNDLVTPQSPELDESIRLALGDPSEDIPVFGKKIPDYIADRWIPILRKGLAKDLKDKLLKEHVVPDNCRLLKAPTLNPEIASAVADVVRARDKKIEVRQNQLGHGITAVSKAMAALIGEESKAEVIKLLSEGCRILTDLHFTESNVRSKLIIPCLDKCFINIIQDEVRDGTLFGEKLPEKIKSAKAIEKQGLQIKRPPPPTSKAVPPQQNTARLRQTGNWNPPPRYPSSANRGGRGGGRPAQYANYRRFQAPPSMSASQHATPTPSSSRPQPVQQTTASRSRAPPRQ